MQNLNSGKGRESAIVQEGWPTTEKIRGHKSEDGSDTESTNYLDVEHTILKLVVYAVAPHLDRLLIDGEASLCFGGRLTLRGS